MRSKRLDPRITLILPRAYALAKDAGQLAVAEAIAKRVEERDGKAKADKFFVGDEHLGKPYHGYVWLFRRTPATKAGDGNK